MPLLALVLAKWTPTAAMTGIVRNPSGEALPSVMVRSSLSLQTDTTDALGAWSLAGAVAVSGAKTPGLHWTKRGLVVDLATAEHLTIDGFDARGRRWLHHEENLVAGHHEIPLKPNSLRSGSYIRVQSASGDALLTAGRAAALTDTISFRLAGYDPIDRILTSYQDTFLTVMTPSLARPGDLSIADLSQTVSTITWDAVSSATGYIVTISGAPGSNPRDTLVGTNGLLVTGMEPGRTVRVRIRAIAGQRVSDSSSGIAIVHRAPLAPLSRGNLQDTLLLNLDQSQQYLQVTVHSWKWIRSLRVRNEAIPFLEDTIMQASFAKSYDSAKAGFYIGPGSRIPVIDTSAWIRVVAYDSIGDSASCRILMHPNPKLVAYWKIDSAKQPIVKNLGWRSLDLSLRAASIWTSPFDSVLTHATKGQIFYQTKVYLNSYPPDTAVNKAQIIMGFYAGLKIGVSSRGQLIVVSQKGIAPNWAWYGTRTANNTFPLNKWVTISVGVDDATATQYAWIDGVHAQMWAPTAVTGNSIRKGYGLFSVGSDPQDGQKFSGKIGDVKVWNEFQLTRGSAPGVDSTIAP